MDKNSLSHTTWECKYHLVFAPKYRRQVIYGQIKADVAEILSMLCKRRTLPDTGRDHPADEKRPDQITQCAQEKAR